MRLQYLPDYNNYANKHIDNPANEIPRPSRRLRAGLKDCKITVHCELKE